MSTNGNGTSPSREAIADLHQMREDAERYRFWRRILLRRPDRSPRTGAPIYSTVLKTLADIDPAEFDRIMDTARQQDDGAKVEFTVGHIAPATAPHADEPEATPPRTPKPLPAVKAPKPPKPPKPPRPAPGSPRVCGCGAVRPPASGRPPNEWTCDNCRGGSVEVVA